MTSWGGGRERKQKRHTTQPTEGKEGNARRIGTRPSKNKENAINQQKMILTKKEGTIISVIRAGRLGMAGSRARRRQMWMGLRAGLGLSFAFTSEETDEKRLIS